MPTYPYVCTACDNSFEIVQSFNDDALSVCDLCDGRLRKVFSSVGVVFKGSGFYRNDSRSNDSRSASGSGEVKAAGGSGGSSEGATGTSNEKPAKADKTPAAADSATPASAPSAKSSPSASKGSAA